MKRRKFVALTLLALPVRALGQANAHISTTDPLVFSLTRGKTVTLELPRIAENGHSVAMTVRVESPMTTAEHVRAVHLISEKNPVREMASFWLGPHSGRAEIGSRIRLDGSQRMVAIAEFSDGSFWSDAVDIEVREAACTDGTGASGRRSARYSGGCAPACSACAPSCRRMAHRSCSSSSSISPGADGACPWKRRPCGGEERSGRRDLSS